MVLSTVALLFSGVGVAFAQFVPPPTDLITKTGYAGYQVRYKEVPKGICELSDAKSYSGYVDVAQDQVLPLRRQSKDTASDFCSTYSSGSLKQGTRIQVLHLSPHGNSSPNLAYARDLSG